MMQMSISDTGYVGLSFGFAGFDSFNSQPCKLPVICNNAHG